MKVLVNGGINLSELDGWWAEAYAPDLGWALGDGEEHHGDPAWDAAEAEMLYDRLEHDVIPEFYSRGTNGVPAAWVARMRESMARLTPNFCTSRTLRDYAEQHYMPAARRYLERSTDNGALGARIVEWQGALAQNWAAVRFGELEVTTRDTQHLFELQVHLHELDPKMVQIELYADGLDGGDPERQIMERLRELEGVPGGHIYAARVPSERPAAHYTPRIMGACDDNVAVPLEAPWIDWQR